MKTLIWIFFLGGIAVGLVAVGGLAEQAPEPQQNLSEDEHTVPQNFEIIIEHISMTEIPSWTGHIFALANGKPVGSVSSEERCQQLAVGNYVLMLHFQETIPEIEDIRPFTFSISEKNKTTFTLLLATSQEPEMEYGIGRSGADFVDSDPRRGRDYVSFELPKNHPELCLARCKKDPNCDAYSYGDPEEWPKARCWLIHGAAVPHPRSYAVSGVITRDLSSYKVTITTEKCE